MQNLSEYQNPARVKRLTEEVARIVTRPWKIMEVCGGQTHNILRYAMDTLLPPSITLLHGPGCPVCVTPASYIDQAIELAEQPDTILCTFGDLLRIPGTGGRTLQAVQALGADIRTIYSPLEVLTLGEQIPSARLHFLAIGFETTVPANAMLAEEILRGNRSNIYLLVSQYQIPPVLRHICEDVSSKPDAFLAPGHVCAITGIRAYEEISTVWKTPIAVTGFEPVDILQGILEAVRNLEAGIAEVTMPYSRAVRPEGNSTAWKLAMKVFEPATREWRGLGWIPEGAFVLRPEYRSLDSSQFLREIPAATEPDTRCPAGDILLGKKTPLECPHFGNACTPETALGPSMVSPEGACAAFYLHSLRP